MRVNTADWGTEFLVQLYRRYGHELTSLNRVDAFLPRIGKSYAGEERRVLYLMVRFFAPEVIFEFSPKRGWSTLHMAAALESNGKGRLFSFELDPVYAWVALRVVREAGWAHRVNVVVGDVREELPKVYERLRRRSAIEGIDFVFIDSDHSAHFAEWYVENLFPVLNPGAVIHVHDIQASPERVVMGGQIFPQPTGEERFLAEYLVSRPKDFRWFSLAELARNPQYLAAVQPYGGGQISFPSNRSWPIHPIDRAAGFERNPALWIMKLSNQETSLYPYRPFVRLAFRARLAYVIRKWIACAYAPLRERRIAARRLAKLRRPESHDAS